MKRLKFTKPNDLSQLHDELLTIPELRPVPADDLSGVSKPVITVEGSGDKIFLTVPDDADEDAIKKVVKAHTPKPQPVPVTKKELKSRLDKAKSFDDLKEVLGVVLERL